jgi:hypothetical protein
MRWSHSASDRNFLYRKRRGAHDSCSTSPSHSTWITYGHQSTPNAEHVFGPPTLSVVARLKSIADVANGASWVVKVESTALSCWHRVIHCEPYLAQAAVRHAACVVGVAAGDAISAILDARQRALPPRKALRVADERVRICNI